MQSPQSDLTPWTLTLVLFPTFCIWTYNKKSQRCSIKNILNIVILLKKREKFEFRAKTCLDFFQVKHLFDLQFLSLVFYPLDMLKPNTVKLVDKERFDKEQIGVKEPFPIINCQFTS